MHTFIHFIARHSQRTRYIPFLEAGVKVSRKCVHPFVPSSPGSHVKNTLIHTHVFSSPSPFLSIHPGFALPGCTVVQPVIPPTDSPLACGLCGTPGVTFPHTAPNRLSPSSGKTEKSFLSCVQCGLSRCNICARACARMSSVWWCEASVESLWHPDVFQFSPHACTHTQGTALIIEHSRLIWLPGGGGC